MHKTQEEWEVNSWQTPNPHLNKSRCVYVRMKFAHNFEPYFRLCLLLHVDDDVWVLLFNVCHTPFLFYDSLTPHTAHSHIDPCTFHASTFRSAPFFLFRQYAYKYKCVLSQFPKPLFFPFYTYPKQWSTVCCCTLCTDNKTRSNKKKRDSNA